jgi:8-oxo-dGTP diphosphatase
MHEPKPLFFQGNAEPAAWVCGKCKAIYGDRAEAVHCCNPSKCRECRAESVDSDLSWERCAACEAKRAARRRQSKRRALEAWRALPNRAPISTHEGMISDADYSEGEDGDGGGYFQDLEHLIDHCVYGGPNPRNLRLFATAKTRQTWTADEMADDFVERLSEEAYEDWEIDGRAELVRLLEPVAALLSGQDLGYHQDNSRPLDFDLPWPPPPSESSERTRVIHPIGAVMVRDGKVFAAKRAPHKAAGGLWEFPGGKPEGDESNEQALARELREEFGIEATVGEWITRGIITDADPTNDDGYLRIELDLYFARWTGGEFVLTDHSEAGWFSVEELLTLEWCPADDRVLYRVTEAVEEIEP